MPVLWVCRVTGCGGTDGEVSIGVCNGGENGMVHPAFYMSPVEERIDDIIRVNTLRTWPTFRSREGIIRWDRENLESYKVMYPEYFAKQPTPEGYEEAAKKLFEMRRK